MFSTIMRTDVQMAINLITLLTDDYQKSHSLLLDLNQKYKMDATYRVLSKIIAALVSQGLVQSKRGVGIKKVAGRIFILDVYKALGVKLTYSTNTPAGRVSGRIYDALTLITIEGT